MKYLMLMLLVCGIIGCGKQEFKIGAENQSLESQLKANLESDIGRSFDFKGVKFYFYNETIKRADGGTTQGLCSYSPNTISIFNSGDYYRNYVNFLHEVGHCILGKKHDDTKPSIMNSVMSDNVLWSFSYNNPEKYNYLNELFN